MGLLSYVFVAEAHSLVHYSSVSGGRIVPVRSVAEIFHSKSPFIEMRFIYVVLVIWIITLSSVKSQSYKENIKKYQKWTAKVINVYFFGKNLGQTS